MYGGLVPFSFQASWPRRGGKQGVGAAGLPEFLLLGAGSVGATPGLHSPLPQPSSPEKLVQLFFSAANSFWGKEGRGGPGLEASGRRRTSLRVLDGVPRAVGDRQLPAAPTPPGKRRAPVAPGGIWVSGSPAAGEFWALVAVLGGGEGTRGVIPLTPSLRHSACLVVVAATPNLIHGGGFTKLNKWVVGVLCFKDGSAKLNDARSLLSP